MAWTSHGYQIPGSTVDEATRPDSKARFGGPGLCPKCNTQVRAFQYPDQRAEMHVPADLYKVVDAFKAAEFPYSMVVIAISKLQEAGILLMEMEKSSTSAQHAVLPTHVGVERQTDRTEPL